MYEYKTISIGLNSTKYIDEKLSREALNGWIVHSLIEHTHLDALFLLKRKLKTNMWKYLIIPAIIIIMGIILTVCGYLLDDLLTSFGGGFIIGVIITALLNKEKYHQL